MTPEIEDFLKNRIQRFRDISLDLDHMGYPCSIVEICDLIERYLVDRPDHPFFKQAFGTRFVRLDLKWLFPATLGMDLRQYLTGPQLLFDPTRLLQEKKVWDKNTQHALQSISRWFLLLSTYNMYTTSLEEKLFQDPFFDPFKKQIEKHKEYLTEYLLAKLQKTLADPLAAKTLTMERGTLEWRVNGTVADQMLKGILDQVKKGGATISCELLDNTFEQLCSGHLISLDGESLLVDTKLQVELNLKRLRKNTIREPELLNILKCRYDLATYLLVYILYSRKLQQMKDATERIKVSLTRSGLQFDQEFLQSFMNFMGEDQRFFERCGFIFDPLTKEDDLAWPRKERRSVYLGAKPENNVSPEHLPLPRTIKNAQKRPVVIMLDISGSMSFCMEHAVEAVKHMFSQLKGHPVSIVVFATWAGLLNRGEPWISKAQGIEQELPWFKELLTLIAQEELGGATSIGNGIMLAKALAVSIASRMDSLNQWKTQNGITSHCILVSDNMHNTPRDVSVISLKGHYIVKSPQNLVLHAVKKGCMVYNVICSSFIPWGDGSSTRENPGNSKPSLIYSLYKMQQKLAFNETLYGESEQKSSLFQTIRKQLYLVDVVEGTLKFKRTLVQQGSEKKNLFEFQHHPDTKASSLIELACLVCYVRQFVTPNPTLMSVFQGLIQPYQIKMDDFMGETLDVSRLQPFCDYLLQPESLDFTLYNLVGTSSPMKGKNDQSAIVANTSIIDGDIMGIFRISKLITETQQVVKNLSNYSVVLNEYEPIEKTVEKVVAQINLYEEETIPQSREESGFEG
ncbi:MAG: VWA domain-containing protein [SAR324 cluster bacterium]|nr:VWA domain-containing protein [SAR324 cluster bacterium]